MFRFYKITRFTDGTQHIDVGPLVSHEVAVVEMAVLPLMVGEVGGTFTRTVTEFLVYEG